MRYDQKPVHRKIIVPWYDSEVACLSIICAMILVFLLDVKVQAMSLESYSAHT